MGITCYRGGVLMNKKGFISIELIMVSGFILFLMAILIGIFNYIYPTFSLQRDVDLLTRQAQRNGGLTYSDVANFKNKVSKYYFVKDSGKSVIVEGKTITGRNIIGVDDNNYISKESGDVMNIIVKVPANNKIISKFTRNSTDYYTFKASVLSEKL